MTLLVVLALVFAGCGGGGGGGSSGGSGGGNGGGNGSGGDGPGGGGLFIPTAEDYMGTWRCDDPKIPFSVSVEFTVGAKNGEWDRGSYHQGSIKCGVFAGDDALNITGNSPDKDLEGWIELCLDQFFHYIHVEKLQEISDTCSVRVSVNGQLKQKQPGVIGVHELTISKGEDYETYRSIEHNDELLLFYKQ